MRVPVVRLHKETARVCTCTGRGEGGGNPREWYRL